MWYTEYMALPYCIHHGTSSRLHIVSQTIGIFMDLIKLSSLPVISFNFGSYDGNEESGN